MRMYTTKDEGLASPAVRTALLKEDIIPGSEILLRTLLLEGVECVFGYPGGALLYIYDAMHGSRHFRHILTRHEQGAIHAADGYARSTGRTGVCLATSGPGATNLVTGIATAYADSVPLVVITGNVATSLIGTDAFQEADIIGMTQPITKHSYFVRRAEDLAQTLRCAFHLAGTGRKGPVLVDIPKDVSAELAAFRYPETVEVRGYEPYPEPDSERIAELLDALACAERPLLLAGGGAVRSGAEEALLAFAGRAGIPVTTTLLGLAAFPGGHPLWLGMPGMHGTYAANRALQHCDLLISAGARFDDRVTMKLESFAPKAEVAHIDLDPAEVGKLVPVSIPLIGDVRLVLEALLKQMPQPAVQTPAREAWLAQVRRWQEEQPLKYTDSAAELKPQYVIELLSRTSGGEAIVTTDVGQHQMWVAQYFRLTRPRSFLTSGGLGTMGFGFPSAIGAQIGSPGRLVISINGDGGMQMCAQELAVCALHGLPVKIAVINNRTLGMIRQWQELIYEGRFSHIDLAGSPDFVLLAETYGVKAFRASSREEADEVWRAALAHPGPVLVDFVVAKEELVYPMIPQGRGLDDMILGGDVQ
ncbi:biosynthetic-type acetolactate synthase large subunit [Paenibacillus mucilaginosus]|uniref:Acetolactate synthase n=1 Tax=Paenibacillus mucilaginosus (strain KNP414) TaxID=1036673 RepID=F8FDI4_PAEMK|nr:biosynthetic-type acetolactate synthase large subunit [Paenibacillus mucilaginosus]AEI42154.1 IlvB2 [Paenibacillus mucilaginosus KNP414]MCG7214128.1 biosynthetic-type acetolactate synthase large subunit [Paenibacillus mucilaginosus]WDM28648.1 biosynthetic-type acetolactate synthase large subunit [Paenibacillus mucilaginosus]